MIDLRLGDCLQILPTLAADSVDSIITDPPAGISFMGKEWDADKGGRAQWIDWLTSVMKEGFRVLKPGGMVLVWAIPRTSHWTATALENAGFEIRDKIYHLFGSGFPKSHNFSKSMNGDGEKWDGWGTALKPAAEEWILAMKPVDGTFAENALRWGVAGINVDGCRIGYLSDADMQAATPGNAGKNGQGATWGTYGTTPAIPSPAGRWPANLILDEEAGALLDAQSGERPSGGGNKNPRIVSAFNASPVHGRYDGQTIGGDTGGASRFFYCAKASRSERNAGLEGMPPKVELIGAAGHKINPMTGRPVVDIPRANHHPCVKPLALMRYLCRLTATPAGGVVLDMFAGSGSTGCAAVLEGRSFIGVEREAEYYEIMLARIEAAQAQMVLEI